MLELDRQRREMLVRVETLKAERNAASEEVARRKRASEPADDLMAQLKASGEEVRRWTRGSGRSRPRWTAALTDPQLPHERVPDGDASANRVVRSWGEPPKFDFAAQAALGAGRALGMLDLPAGAKIAGSGFPLFRGMGAKLVRALANFMLDLHTREHGYTEGRASLSGEPRHRSPAPASCPSSKRRCTPRRPTICSSSPRPKCRSPTSTATRSSRRCAAERLRGLHALLPARGRLGRQGHARADPGSPVRQGRAGPLVPPEDRRRSTSESPATPKRCCSGWSCLTGSWSSPPATRDSPAREPTTSKSGRPAWAPGSRSPARARSPISRPGARNIRYRPGAQGQARVRAHAECIGRRLSAHDHRPAGEQPGGRRVGAGARGPGAVSGRRSPGPPCLASGFSASRPRWSCSWRLLAGLSLGTGVLIFRHFKADASATSRLYSGVFGGLNNPRPGARSRSAAPAGRAGALARAPTGRHRPQRPGDCGGKPAVRRAARRSARAEAYAARLDRQNPPIVDAAIGTVHYGPLPAQRNLIALAVLQALTIAVMVAVAVFAYRSAMAAQRDRLWVAMAREAAHQMGTPLTSLRDGSSGSASAGRRRRSWPIT